MSRPSSARKSQQVRQPASLRAARISGHTSRCRARYSSRRSGRTRKVKQTRMSEVELVDVVLGEHGRRAEDDLALGADRVVTEVTGLVLLALRTGDLPGRERGGGVGGEVAELARVPQRERLHGAVLDELAHLVRRAQTGQLDLALVLR